MSYIQAIREIKEFAIYLWANCSLASTQLRHQGVEGPDVPPNAFWGRASIQTVIQEQRAISRNPGDGLYETEGLFFIEVFAPKIEAGSFMIALNAAAEIRERILKIKSAWPCNVRFKNVRISEGSTNGKWSQVRLVADWTYDEVVGQAPPVSPRDVPDLFSWGRGDVSNRIVIDGRYYSIQDKVDSTKGFYNETAIRRPMAVEYQGKLCPFFTPLGTFLKDSREIAEYSFLVNGAPSTVMFRLLTPASLAGGSVPFIVGSGSVNGTGMALQFNANGSVRLLVGKGSSPAVVDFTSAAGRIFPNSFHTIGIRKLTSDRYELFADGVLIASNDANLPYGSLPITGLTIGGNGSSGTFNSMIFEWLTVKRAVEDSELHQLFDYLAREWA